MKSPRYWTVVLFLAGTLLILLARGNRDVIPASEPLSQFPHAIARLYPKCGGAADRPLHRLFSHPEDRRHHPFTQALSAWRRLVL